MNAEKISRMEKLLDRKLSDDEITRLRRIKDVLGISDSDAIWDVLTAMEYQWFYYDELPQKIAGLSEVILEKIESAAAGNSTSKKGPRPHFSMSLPDAAALIPYTLLFLAALLSYGSLLLWAGFGIGAGQAHPPELILRMPSGLLVGGLCLMGGVLLGVRAAKDFAEGEKSWRKPLLAALALLLPGGIIISLAV